MQVDLLMLLGLLGVFCIVEHFVDNLKVRELSGRLKRMEETLEEIRARPEQE